MKTTSTLKIKKVCLAACVALMPAGAALAAQAGAAGPISPQAGACESDPFYLYEKSVHAEGAPYRCVPMVSETSRGAMGPAGPVMMGTDETACRDDPFYGYQRAVHPEGPPYQCIGMWSGPSGAQGPAGPIMVDTQGLAPGEAQTPYHRAFVGD